LSTGQLGIRNKYTNLANFTAIESLTNHKIKQVEAHLTQSACLLGTYDEKYFPLFLTVILEDGQVLQWGWVLDSLTSARTLSFYKRMPKAAKFWQVKASEFFI
jgi:hypothetical protein